MERFADFIQSRPRLILLVFAGIIAVAVFPAIQIETDFNLENFFPEDDPSIRDYQYLEKEFGRDDNIIIVGFHSDSLLSKSVLSDLKTIVDLAEQISYITEVRSLWSEKRVDSDGQRLRFDPFLEKEMLDSLDTQKLRKKLSDNPFAGGYLINEKMDITAFYLTIEDGYNNYEIRNQILASLNNILAPYRSRYDFKITGIPYYRNQYVEYLNDEIVFYFTASSILILLLLWILYRSMTGLVIPIIIVWVTILLTLAVMHLTGGYFEVMTSTIAPILVCVGIADSIHMISKYDDARLLGFTQKRSIKEMLVTLGSATLLTSITTAIGFGTLFTSEIVPMKRFGIYTAAGVMLAFVITIFLLPSGLSLFNVKRVFKDKSAWIFNIFNGFLDWISHVTRNNFKKIALLFLLLTITAASGIYFLRVNGQVFDELGRDTQPIQYAQFFSDNLAPPFPMEFIIDTREENGITDPDFIRRLNSFTADLKERSEFARVISFNTLIKEMHRALAPDEAEKNILPDDKRLLSQYLLLLEVNDADALERVTDFNYQKVRITTNVYDIGSYRINNIQDELRNRLIRLFPESEITLTGTTVLSADLNQKIVASLFKSIGLAFLLISIIMAVMFRNSRMVFISLVPNLLPLIFVAGFMGFAGIDIKASTAVIFTIAFGIAVDDSIHYLARLRIEMRRGKSLFEALDVATKKTGKAIIVTSLVLLVGFGSLTSSVFQSTVNMGLLVCLTIFAALLADLLLLPSLFYWMKPDLNLTPDDRKSDPRSSDEPREEGVLYQS